MDGENGAAEQRKFAKNPNVSENIFRKNEKSLLR